MIPEFYHNKNCSKSRAALALLEEKEIDFKKINYLEEGLTYEQIDGVLKALGVEPIDFIRMGEPILKSLNIRRTNNKTKRQWINLMLEYPIIFERPVLVNGDRAVIGRPPEKILTIL